MESCTELTVDQFISFKKVNIKDADHKKVVNLFYRYLQSVSGDQRLLPSIIGTILGVDLTDVVVLTGCFNGVNDRTVSPYANVDFYIKLSNGIKVYIYGRRLDESVCLSENEYVVFVNAEEIKNNILRKDNHYIYLF